VSQRAKGLGGPKFWKGVKNVAGAAVAIGVAVGAGMAASALGAGLLASVGVGLLAWPAIGVGYGLLTNSKEFWNRPFHAIGSYALGGLDFGLSMILNPLQGKDQPFVKHYPGGAVIHNSFIANNIVGSFSLGGAAFLESGESRQVMLHERGHNRTQTFVGRDIWGGFKQREFDADLKAGTMNYLLDNLMIYGFLLRDSNPQLLDAMLLYNATINPKQALFIMLIIRPVLFANHPAYTPDVPL